MKRSPLPTRKTPLKRSQKSIERRTGIKRTRIKPRPVGVNLPLQTREALRERAKGRCERCNISDRTHHCEGHHRLLKSQGGKDDLTNLAFVCRPCHRHIHDHPKESKKAGWIIGHSVPETE